MSTRTDVVADAARGSRRRLNAVASDLRSARLNAGLSQRSVAAAVGCSRQLIGHLEAGRVTDPGSILLSRCGAVVGLEVSLRAYPAGSPLRDAGQLGMLARFRALIGLLWHVRTEVPVGRGDQRAFDAVLTRGEGRGGRRVAVECISRLTDAQAQIRAVLLKGDAAQIECIVLVLADTRWNRIAVREAAPTLAPAFPLGRRAVLRSLRAGEVPPTNGVLLA